MANEMDSNALHLQPPLNLPHAYFSWESKRWDRLGRYQAYARGLEAIANQLARLGNGISIGSVHFNIIGSQVSSTGYLES